MSTFVLKREYALQMPKSYVDIDRDEMEYIDGGFYVSNRNLKSIICCIGFNPIISAAAGFGYYKAVALISNKMGLLFAKFGSLGGPMGTLAGYIFGAYSASNIAITVVDALVAGKGLKFGFTWRPTLDVQ